MQKQSDNFYLRFSECVEKIEREISPAYIPGAIAWVDAVYDGAFSKAADRLERSIIKFRDRVLSEHDFQIEQAIYFDTLTEYFIKYRKHKNLDESEHFLKSFMQGEIK